MTATKTTNIQSNYRMYRLFLHIVVHISLTHTELHDGNLSHCLLWLPDHKVSYFKSD